MNDAAATGSGAVNIDENEVENLVRPLFTYFSLLLFGHFLLN